MILFVCTVRRWQNGDFSYFSSAPLGNVGALSVLNICERMRMIIKNKVAAVKKFKLRHLFLSLGTKKVAGIFKKSFHITF